jgi:hypothetical protein
MKVPKNKTDFESLEGITKEEIIEYQDLLLEWLEDINWPVSTQVIKVLSPYISSIEQGIIKVLKSSDYEWAYNVVLHLLTTTNELPESIIYEIRRICETHTEFEELRETCEMLLNNLKR